MQFEEELARVLPADLPQRVRLIEKAGIHLTLLEAANEHMNLTRITDPQEAAIKHVYDSVAPWRHFQNSRRILDAGTGAGFPGIPLALVLPDVHFTLSESTQKKARFLDAVVDSLDLHNVRVTSERAEQVALNHPMDVITARALAPLARILDLFQKALKQGARLILYKGPDVEAELADIQKQRVVAEVQKHRLFADVLSRYDLPEGLGTRTLLQLAIRRAERAAPRKQASANQ